MATQTVIINQPGQSVGIDLHGAVSLAVIEQATTQVATTHETGPQGPAGPPGDGDSSLASYLASAAVSGHRGLVIVDGQVRHADAADPADAHLALAVSLGAASLGGTVAARQYGPLQDATFAFAVGVPVFLGADGALTQTVPAAPAAAFVKRIGVATAIDTLFVDPEEAIFLS